MELIARVTVRRCEMGEAGDAAQRHAAGKSLTIFRVLGRSPERAIKVFNVERLADPDQVMVLSIRGKDLSEDEKQICSAVLEQGVRQSMKIVFCGGDPSQIFGRLATDDKALKWFPSIPSFISTFEIEGGRQTASHT